MSIRCASKALILHQGKVLLNRCRHADGRVYYDLPGGGQHPYETMREALVREVLEETGCRVRVVRFAALAEEIYTDPELRRRFPDYTHRICHIFLAELLDEPPQDPSEIDFAMEQSVWVNVNELDTLPEVCPNSLMGRFAELLHAGYPIDLGTDIHREKSE